MREITEKEVKLKQQLLESPAHQKVKGKFHFSGTHQVNVAPVLKNCVCVCSVLVLCSYSPSRERVPWAPALVARARWPTALSPRQGQPSVELGRVGERWEVSEAPEEGT